MFNVWDIHFSSYSNNQSFIPWPQSAQTLTLSGLIMNTDSLGLIVAIIILYTHEMQESAFLIETGTSARTCSLDLFMAFIICNQKKRAIFLPAKNGHFWCAWHSTAPSPSQRRKRILFIKVAKKLLTMKEDKGKSVTIRKSSTYTKIPLCFIGDMCYNPSTWHIGHSFCLFHPALNSSDWNQFT